jgi:Flp pilus assembly protein TadD
MNKMIKVIGLVLLGGFFFFLLSGCSNLNNMLRWAKFWDSGEKNAGPADKDVARFVSNVRPQPGNPDSHYLLACYHQERGRHREAIKEFQKVILIDPNYVEAYNGMGVSYDLLGDFSGAAGSYQKALKLNPGLDYVQNNLGYSYLLQGDFDEAITSFKKAIALNTRGGRFHNNLGLAYALKGQFDLATAEFKLAGDEARAYYNIAQFYYKKGLYDEAKSRYAMALTLDPSFTGARTNLEAASALGRISQPAGEKSPDRHAFLDIEEVQLSDSSQKHSTPLLIPEQRAGVKQQNLLRKAGIEISNGNGVNRMARRVGNYLKEKGLKVNRLTNADNFNHAETKIYYQKGHHEAACYMARQIPGSQNKNMEKSKFDRPNIKVKVLIGKDLIPYHKVFARDYQQS